MREWSLDSDHVRAAFARAATHYDDTAVLARRVADELLSRLDVVILTPRRIIDLGCGTGYCARELEVRYRRAEVIGIDQAMPMVRTAAKARRWRSRKHYLAASAEHVPLADQSVELVVSNLMLAWTDRATVFREIHRILTPEGLLTFSTFGPDTLKEIRQAWETVDSTPHVHPFLDMHDIGDALLESGFAGPVMDVEYITLTYPGLDALLRDLKGCGWQNVLRGRRATLTGRSRFAAFARACDAYRAADGRIPLTFELVYGHAWRAPDDAHRPSEDRKRVTVRFE